MGYCAHRLVLVLVQLGLALWSFSVSGAPLKIAVSLSPMSAPLYVADQLGYFRQEGVDVALKPCTSGALCFKQMLDGVVDLATVGDLPIMFRSFDRRDFVVLTTFSTSTSDVKVIARRSAGISSMRDLQGKRVGVLRGTASQYYFDLAMLSAGIDSHSVELTHLDLTKLDQVAVDPQIHAFSLFQPSTYQLIKMLGKDAVVIPAPALYTLSFNLLARTGNESRRGEWVKIIRALDRAVDTIQNRPQQACTLVSQALRLEPSATQEFWGDYRFGLRLNQSLLTTLESEARWAIREGLVSGQLPNFLDYIDPQPLRQVRSTAVTLVK